MAKLLVVIAGKDKGRQFTLPDTGNFSIGRGNTTDTRLTDVRVSRTHCELQTAGDQLKIVDAKSAVGTFVNNERVEGERTVQAGDVIRIGDTELRLDDEDLALQATVAGISAAELGGGVLERARAAVTGGPLTDLVGSTVGHFQISALLARGESSVVFRAHDTTEARSAALKILLPTASKTDGEMQRIVRNLQPYLPLRHENLISLYSVGKDRGYCWFAMELVDGENLTQLLQRVGMAGMLNWDHALRIGIHVARALVELHKHRVLHRNITPRSVLINNSDKLAKLGGMWLARSLDATDTEPTARPTDMLRDLPFLPPEAMHGDSAKRDERSDLYSFGATLYALLTGRAPFETRTIAETITQVLQKPPARPREFQLSLPASFENIVLRLLAKKPAERYSTAAAVLEDLERLARDPTGPASGNRRNGEQPQEADGVIPVICSNPSCGQRLQARKKSAGTQVRCPTCGTMLVVPGQAVPVQAAAAPVLRPAAAAGHAPLPRTLEVPKARPVWPRAVAAAAGAGIVLAALAWVSGLFGPKDAPATQPEPAPTEKATPK